MNAVDEKLVFVIDDTRVFNSFIRNYLTSLGNFRVEVFEDGDQAMKQLNNQTPYFIILDHQLTTDSRVDGIYYLGQIKNLKPKLPVFFVTGENNVELAKLAIEKGATEVLIKNPELQKNLSKAIHNLKPLSISDFIRKTAESIIRHSSKIFFLC